MRGRVFVFHSTIDDLYTPFLQSGEEEGDAEPCAPPVKTLHEAIIDGLAVARQHGIPFVIPVETHTPRK